MTDPCEEARERLGDSRLPAGRGGRVRAAGLRPRPRRCRAGQRGLGLAGWLRAGVALPCVVARRLPGALGSVAGPGPGSPDAALRSLGPRGRAPAGDRGGGRGDGWGLVLGAWPAQALRCRYLLADQAGVGTGGKDPPGQSGRLSLSRSPRAPQLAKQAHVPPRRPATLRDEAMTWSAKPSQRQTPQGGRPGRVIHAGGPRGRMGRSGNRNATSEPPPPWESASRGDSRAEAACRGPGRQGPWPRLCGGSQKKKTTTERNRGGRRQGTAGWTGSFLLTSRLLSSDPALLRRPRFPAQNMQYQRLDTTGTGRAPPARLPGTPWPPPP